MHWKFDTPGIPDELFERSEQVPITKEEVRALTICKLRLKKGYSAIDVGCGSGSLTVEICNQIRGGVVYAIDFDEKAVQQVVSNIDELRKALPIQMQSCLAFFPNVDRTVGGYEGLMAAQQCLPNNDIRDKFASEYSTLGTIWEALSPDQCLIPYEKDYRWLTQVYESVEPPRGPATLAVMR